MVVISRRVVLPNGSGVFDNGDFRYVFHNINISEVDYMAQAAKIN
jgi:hypothetical protein